MKKVYVEGSNHDITVMFRLNDWQVVSELSQADLVCFEGGADVSPELYGEKNTDSYCSDNVDFKSFVIYNNARRLDLPMVGICRGGQFLNVMAGGKMIQDYGGHAIRGTHKCLVNWDYSEEIKEEVMVTSTHHQIMIPDIDKSILIGHHPDNKSEVEIVWHPHENSLSFQPHPEYVDKDHECQELFFRMLDEFLI